MYSCLNQSMRTRRQHLKLPTCVRRLPQRRKLVWPFHAGIAQNLRKFSASYHQNDIKSWHSLPNRIAPTYHESPEPIWPYLKWPTPPKNCLLVKKDNNSTATSSLKTFAAHLQSVYPSTNILVEPLAAREVSDEVPFTIYSASLEDERCPHLARIVDLVVTFGGDGTILHASSLFASSDSVPPMLSFSMGTLGFLGEWKFDEYKRAFREVYMSGADLDDRRGTLHTNRPLNPASENFIKPTEWSPVKGKAMGTSRAARILMRTRLKVGVSIAGSPAQPLQSEGTDSMYSIRAMNEVIIHRGRDPHLAIVEVFVGGRFLTEAVADGMIVSSPTGSTAYSLSSGGSIVHPFVPSILLTPVCPRSLSFRPLVLPAGTPIALRLSEKNRGRELEVSIDGVRRRQPMQVGEEVKVLGEQLHWSGSTLYGGIPCVTRRDVAAGEADDGWLGGLNGLLKFNYPFGEEI